MRKTIRKNLAGRKRNPAWRPRKRCALFQHRCARRSATVPAAWITGGNACPEIMPTEGPLPLPDIQDCIEISPRDLTALRQPYWCLGRNRFLLRAYGSYQHLLLIQKKDGTVLLGIPGRYDPREARTASAYGFGVFLKAASENARTRFGYWCREVL